MRSLVLALALLAACDRTAEVIAPAAPDERDAGEAVAPRPVERERFIGVVLPSVETVLTAPAAAKVERIDVKVGDTVEAGQVVAVLDGPSLERARASAEAEVKAVSARLRAARVLARSLRKKHETIARAQDVVSGDVIESARTAAAEAAAERDRLAAELEQARAAQREAERLVDAAGVRAPFSGTVAARLVEPGRDVARGAPILRVVGDGRPWLRFAVPPSAPAPAVGQAVSLSIDGRDEIRGEVVRVAPEVAPLANVLVVEASLEVDAADLRYGTRGRVTVQEPPAPPLEPLD